MQDAVIPSRNLQIERLIKAKPMADLRQLLRVALESTNADAGSPGIRKITAKDISETNASTGIATSSRRKANRRKQTATGPCSCIQPHSP